MSSIWKGFILVQHKLCNCFSEHRLHTHTYKHKTHTQPSAQQKSYKKQEKEPRMLSTVYTTVNLNPIFHISIQIMWTQSSHSPTHHPPVRLYMEENRQVDLLNIDTRSDAQRTWIWEKKCVAFPYIANF